MATVLLLLLVGFASVHAKVVYKVQCTNTTMTVDVMKTEDVTAIYLDQLKGYPDKACQPEVTGTKATFKLSLEDIFRCGTTRMLNTLTGRRLFYQRVVVEYGDLLPKEVILVKCDMHNLHAISKRDILPAGFEEPEYLDITSEVTGLAPEPYVFADVRQNGRKIEAQLNVQPGTPLHMEIYLDNKSAPTYGLLVSQMEVTDTASQNEIIILNGCSEDPYLFENFKTDDGDFLKTQFRAFKFPESSYVEFRGTVNVCLDKCRGIECKNGQIGFGRRRRAVSGIPYDANKVMEYTVTTFIKVECKEGDFYNKGCNVDKIQQNQTRRRPEENEIIPNQVIEAKHVQEEVEFTILEEIHNTASWSGIRAATLILSALLTIFVQ